MHFVNNSTSILMTRLFPQFEADTTLKEMLTVLSGSSSAYWIAVVFSAGVAVISIYMINRFIPKGGDSFAIREVPATKPENTDANHLN